MAVRINPGAEVISLQPMGTLGKPSTSTSHSVQFIPPQKPAKQQRSNWQVVKRLLRASRPNPLANFDQIPDYPPNSHVPLHAGFEDEETLAKVLSEISKKDDHLQEYLDTKKAETLERSDSVDLAEEERDKFGEDGSPVPKQIPEDLSHYQDCVSQFLSFFLLSSFAHSERNYGGDKKWTEVVQRLASSRNCPDMMLFRRVAVDPKLIASITPEEDNIGFADNGVAVNQLARFLDVAVVKFLSSVNEHTDSQSVVWALDYLNNLLQSLISSMNNLNSFGWYAAPHMRIRKGTAMGRTSISYQLQAPIIFNPPPVVVVGTPPTSPRASPDRNLENPVASLSPSAEASSRSLSPHTRDPVTGQHSPVLSPLAVRHMVAPAPLPPAGENNSEVAPWNQKDCKNGGQDENKTREYDRAAEDDAHHAVGRRSRRTSRQEVKDFIKPPLLDDPSSPRSSRSASYSPSPTRERRGQGSGQALHGILKTPSLDNMVSPPRSPNASRDKIVAGSSPKKPAVGRQRRPTPVGPPPELVLPPRNIGHHSSPGSSPRQSRMNIIQEDEDEDEDGDRSSEGSLHQSTGSINSLHLSHPNTSAINVPSSKPRSNTFGSPKDFQIGRDKFSPERTFASFSPDRNRDRFSPDRTLRDRFSPERTLRDRFSPDRTLRDKLSPDRMRDELRSPPSTGSHRLGSISENEDDEFETSFQLSHPPPGKKADQVPDATNRVSRSVSPVGSPTYPSSISPSPSPLQRSISPPPVGVSRRGTFPNSPPPSAPKELPVMNVSHELRTLTNAEGRISLLAILDAISRLPNCKEVWSDEVSERCYALIQFCIDIGLPPKGDDHSSHSAKKKTTSSSGAAGGSLQDRRRRMVKQENASEKLLAEKPWVEHGKCIVEYSLRALIHCSTCSLVGCSSDDICRLQKYVVPSTGRSSMYSKLIRNLKRISLHSPKVFREVMVNFAKPSASSCRKLFSFLHIVLQYCSHADGAISMGSPLTDIIVVGVAGVVVDRLAILDLSEESIQESVVREACDFIGYSSSLFAVDTEVKSRHHFHMYIHRVALSVLLPPHPSTKVATPTTGPTPSNFTSIDVAEIRGTDCADGPAAVAESGPTKILNKALTKRGTLVNAFTSSPLLSRRGTSNQSGSRAPRDSLNRSDRPFLSKQTTLSFSTFSETVHPLPPQEDKGKRKRKSSRENSQSSQGDEVTGGASGAPRYWRGLDIDMLRSRIKRLSTVLELSEPGSIPEAGMLASLVDLCDGTTVVARAMVFVECSLLVKKLRFHSSSQPATIWLRHNSDSPQIQQVAANLRKWAEAVGERLRLAELRQKAAYDESSGSQTPSTAEGKGREILEESVYPPEENHKDQQQQPSSGKKLNGEGADRTGANKTMYLVSHALKMCACNLLLEITRFLRELPTEFIPPQISISQAGTPLNLSGNFDRFSETRKYSNSSMMSSDAEGTATAPHFPNPRPHLPEMRSTYGSSLSVEDAEISHEYPRGLSIDSVPPTPSNTTQRRNRTSMYLRITPSSNKTGVSRNTSTRRHSRRIVVTDKQEHKLSMPKQLGAVSPMRARRRSISTGLQRSTSGVGVFPGGGISNRRPSLFIPSSANQTSLLSGGGFTNATSSHHSKGRRKSMGAALHYPMPGDANEFFLPPVTPTTPGGQFLLNVHRGAKGVGGGGGSGGGGGISIGNSLNIGLTKLKRSAQRAFRRGGKSRSGEVVSPTNSPSASQRKKIRRASTADSYTQRSIFIPSQPEETHVNYPWLDVVEHLILVSSVGSVEDHLCNKRSCLELATALKKVYSAHTSAGKDEDEEQMSGQDGKSGKDRSSVSGRDSVSRGGKKVKRYSSLGSIFIHGVSLVDMDSGTDSKEASYNRNHSMPALITLSTNSSMDSGTLKTLRSSSVQPSLLYDTLRRGTPMKQISFSDINVVRLRSLLMGGDGSGGSNLTSEEMIQLTIESESRYDGGHIAAVKDKEVCKYLDENIAGFLHIPFSTLIGAAPILHSRTFGILKGIAWDVLLSVDRELSRTAGSFFLLATARETEKQMKGFVKSRILNQTSEVKKNAILRFKVLWDNRYGVWSRMEEKGQKKFVNNEKEDKEDEKTIGYSQLANPLGDQGSYLPLSPSDPISVCTSKACADNPDKCYRPTKLAPVKHPKEISREVQSFPVSGVSIPQEVGGTESNSVIYKVDSDDIAGAREYEAVDPTLFPHSLLPLIKFLLFSLVPNNKHHTSSHKTTPTITTPTAGSVDQLEGSELARQVVWDCMVEDPRLFFRPLLNKFNKLYAMGDEKKHSAETLLAETLEPFHIVLQEFPKLPSRAAHMLLNNFVGVVLQHTDQPYSMSSRVIHSVLSLVSMRVRVIEAIDAASMSSGELLISHFSSDIVQGLDMKQLKSYLKKESCYTNIMATARIRGVDRILLVPNRAKDETVMYKVTDNEMTFGHLIAEVHRPEELSLKLLSRWYLVDRNTDLPVLSTLVVQDHYSAPINNGQHPTFVLHKVTGSPERFWSDEMDKLFVFKMNEVVKVQFSTQLLLTGPEVEKTHTYSEYALPNYQFMHKELVELNSFPRKVLTSVQHEAGPNAFQNVQLRASDIMLKGAWVRFVLQLIMSASRDYDWANTLPLFMNVVNGSLLLHSEDHTILYFTLSTMLLTAAKFEAIFKRDGYLMVIPALIHVYGLHMRNRVIKGAIKFVWHKFFTLDGNQFVSQLMAAASTLLSEEVASLSHNVAMGASLTGMLTRNGGMEVEEARRLIANALFELIGVLVEKHPDIDDELKIMRFCQAHLDPDLYARLENHDSTQSLSVKETAVLAIVFAGWNPEAIRGMQVLVYLQHMLPLFLPILGTQEQRFIIDSVQFLVKKCESISKVPAWTGGFSRSKSGNPKNDSGGGGGGSSTKILNPGQSFNEEELIEHSPQKTRKVSVAEKVTKILYNPNRKERLKTSNSRVTFANPSVNNEGEGLDVGEAELDDTDQGGQAAPSQQNRGGSRIQGPEHQIFHQSRSALLSIVAEIFAYYSRVPDGGKAGNATSRRLSVHVARKASIAAEDDCSPSKIALDSGSVHVIINIVCQMLKQSGQNEALLQSPGLNKIFCHFLFGLDWTEQHFSAFANLLNRLQRFFRVLQKDTTKLHMVWENLNNIVSSLTVCIHHNPQLIRGQDQHLTKFKGILELLVAMQRGEPQWASTMNKKLKGIQQQPVWSSAPPSFTEAVVALAAELIVLTSGSQNTQHMQSKFRYRINDLISQKLLKENEDFLMPKIVLPLCIQLGLQDGGCEVAQEDIDFFIHFIDGKVDIFHRLKNSPEIPDLVFRVLKVFCCSFAESFTMLQWTRVSNWITSLFMRKLSVSLSLDKKVSATSINKRDGGGGGVRGRTSTGVDSAKIRSSRLPSASGTVGTPLEAFISFHENLLSFFEDFVVHCRVPLLPLLQPVLWKMATELEIAKDKLKVDHPGHLDRVGACIDRCHKLRDGSLIIPRFRNRQQLLQNLQDMLKSISSQSTGKATLLRSNTTVEANQQPKKSVTRRMSDVGNKRSLFDIKEGPSEDRLVSSYSLPRNTTPLLKSESTPSKKSPQHSSKRYVDNRPATLSLKPPKSVSIDDAPSPIESELKLHSPPSGPSPSPRSALRKRSPDRRMHSARFHSSMDSLDEEEPNSLKLVAGGASPKHLPPPPVKSPVAGRSGRRSPKLSKLGKSMAISGSIEYPGDVEDDGMEDAIVLENALTQTPSPQVRRLAGRTGGKEEPSSILVNSSASLSPYQTKKKVAFSSESKSESLTLPVCNVQVEVHFNPAEDSSRGDSATAKSSKLKELDSHSPQELEMSNENRVSMLEDSITSETAPLHSSTSDSKSRTMMEVKSVGMEGSSPSMKPHSPRTRSAMATGFSKIRISLSPNNVVGDGDDRDQLLEEEDAHQHLRSDGRDLPYQMWQDASSEAESKLLKSQSLDRGHVRSAGSTGYGSRSLTSALKESTKFLYKRGQRSKSDLDMHANNH